MGSIRNDERDRARKHYKRTPNRNKARPLASASREARAGIEIRDYTYRGKNNPLAAAILSALADRGLD